MPDGRALSIHSSNTASVNTDYVWVDGLPVAQFVDSYDSQNNPIGTTITYLHADHLGTPRIGTSQAQAITWRYRSDAFGIPDAQTSGVVRLRFPGQISLGVAGVHYNYYRDYESQEGRYLESDPIGLEGGINTYGYVDQNPLSGIDPMGLYGSQSCGYYSQACAANRGSYECRVASRACNIFPKKQNYFDCARQCLQERHKGRQSQPNSCSADNNIGLGANASDHSTCLSGCLLNPENPYAPKGPDLPDADVDLLK
jgi:RHS repeat-associated protein